MLIAYLITPISPDKWIELLKLYGPMALFVFMVFVLLVKAKATAGSTSEEKRIQLFALTLVWVSIFILAAIIVVVYWKTNFPREYVVVGKITNLSYPQVIVTEQEIFLHKRTVAGFDFEYDWRLIENQRFLGTVELLLQQKPTDSDVLRYKIPFQKEFYEGNVEIEYEPDTYAMTLTYGKNRSVIMPTKTRVAEFDRLLKDNNGTVVLADVVPRAGPKELIRALDADDPLIRVSARRDLASFGSRAIPAISDALSNPGLSYRLRLGLLATLLDMGSGMYGSLSVEARCSIAKFSKDADSETQKLAASVIGSRVGDYFECAANVPQKANSNDEPKATLLENRSLQPADLTSSPAGVFLLDRNGVIFRVSSTVKGPHLEKILTSSLQGHTGYVAASEKDLFVATDFKAGCLVSKFSLSGQPEGDRPLVAHYVPSSQTCGGIVAMGDAVYILLPGSEEIRYWTAWNQRIPKSLSIHLDGSDALTSLVFDRFGQRLLLSRGSGNLYAAKIDGSGNLSPLEKIAGNTKATGNSISASENYILIASGKKIVALDRANNTMAKSLSVPNFATNGTLVGLTIDEQQNLWLADNKGTIRGPIRLNASPAKD
jgi:hypothetical protein